jgi:hypothetical protein
MLVDGRVLYPWSGVGYLRIDPDSGLEADGEGSFVEEEHDGCGDSGGICG